MLPGQGCTLHIFVSTKVPSQSFPRNCGTGLVHVLILDWTPPPHVALHSEYSANGEKPPSTIIKQENTWIPWKR